MREITIESKRFGSQIILVDDEDYDKVNQFRWHIQSSGNTYYARRSGKRINGKKHQESIKLHRFILDLTDSKIVVDHINHNGLDNQKSNLRICSHSDNVMNVGVQTTRTLNSTSMYKGVCWHKNKNKWVTQIQVGNKKIHVGAYEREIDGAYFYNLAAIKYHGEFACLNDIPEDFVCSHIERIYTSKYRGVYYDDKNKSYRVKIVFNKKAINLGKFSNDKEAAMAYNEAAVKYYGDKAVLNIIIDNELLSEIDVTNSIQKD